MTRRKRGRKKRSSGQPAGRSPVVREVQEEGSAKGSPAAILVSAVWLLLFLLAAALAFRQVASPDIGFHLKAGDLILDTGTWPRLDPFTYAMRDHPYIDTSWGFQLVAALLYRAGGAQALVIGNVAAILAIFALLAASMRFFPCPAWFRPAVFLIALLACEMRFEVRPEILSWLFLTLEVYLLNRRAAGRSTKLWILPLIQLVWTNCHALFVLGLVVMGCFALSESIVKRRVEKPLFVVLAVSLAVSVINPYGIKGALFPLELATRLHRTNVFASSIGEFTSPFALGLTRMFPFFPLVSLGSFWIFLLLALVALPKLWRRRNVASLFLFAAFFVLSSRMIRNIPLLILVMAPAVCCVFPRRSSGGGARSEILWLLVLAVVSIGFLARVVTDGYYISTRRATRFGAGLNRLVLPVETAAFLARSGFHGKLLNHINLGGYLLYWQPSQVFIDGRLEVVGEEFYKQYRYFMSSARSVSEAREIYGFDLVVLPYRIAPKTVSDLSKSPDWELIHVDQVACIFQATKNAKTRLAPSRPPTFSPAGRKIPGIDGASRPGRLQRFLEGFVRKQRFPVDAFNTGLFYLFTNDLGDAERAFRVAIQESGGRYYEIYNNLGAALFRQHRYEEAMACYRVVLEDHPKDRLARERLSKLVR